MVNRDSWVQINCTFAALALIVLMTATADAQKLFDGWTDPNFQAIPDKPIASELNQPSLFQDRSPGEGLDHPFFNDSSPTGLPPQDDPRLLKRFFGIEASYLARGRFDDIDFVFDDNGPALSYADIRPGGATAARVRLGLMDAEGRGVEGVYANYDNFGGTTVVDGPNVVPVVYSSIFADPEPSYDIRFTGKLTTYELNVWVRANDNFRYGFGARIFDLREDFNIVISGRPTSDGFFSDADNDLYGLQWLGEYSKPVSQRMDFVAGIKLGGFYNNIDSNYLAENLEFNLDDDVFSFATDFNVGLRHRINASSSLSLGYQLLNISRVALAPNQSRSVNAFEPDADDLDLDNAFFNGAYVGLDVRF